MITSVIKMYDGDDELNTLSVTYDDGKVRVSAEGITNHKNHQLFKQSFQSFYKI